MRIKICIICEGYEEKDYLNKLKNISCLSKIYDITLINAQGIENIFTHYQNKYQQDSYYAILIFCDTDKGYESLKSKINSMFDKDVANKIIFYANPCTMQIVLSHFSKVSLKSSNKSKNKELIKKLTGISNYNASEEKRKALISKIKNSNYTTMKTNIQVISNNDKDTPSTNFLVLLNYLEQDDDYWIKELNNTLES